MSTVSRKHVRASLRDAVFTNLSTGMGESYFVAYLLALGLSGVDAGAGKILPMFLGVCLQFLALRKPINLWGLKKRLVFFIAGQGVLMLSLALCGIKQWSNSFLLFSLLGLYWALGLAAQPPWNRLMGSTLPTKYRANFFALRGIWAQGALLIGLLISAVTLNFFSKNAALQVFIALFFAAGVLKLLSARELSIHHERPSAPDNIFGLRVFLQRLKHPEQGKLIIFLFAWYFVVHIASPYFDPFMLKVLSWSPLQYGIMISTALVGRITASQVLRSRVGPKHVPWLMFIGCFGVSLSPLSWALSQNFIWLMVNDFFCGMSWAMFELSVILLYFQNIKDEERVSLLSYISFTNTSGMMLGTLVGAFFLKNWQLGFHPYVALFCLSFSLRFLMVFFIPGLSAGPKDWALRAFGRSFSSVTNFGAFTREWWVGRERKDEDK